MLCSAAPISDGIFLQEQDIGGKRQWLVVGLPIDPKKQRLTFQSWCNIIPFTTLCPPCFSHPVFGLFSHLQKIAIYICDHQAKYIPGYTWLVKSCFYCSPFLFDPSSFFHFSCWSLYKVQLHPPDSYHVVNSCVDAETPEGLMSLVRKLRLSLTP